MAQQGYWATCEPIKPKGIEGANPSAYFVQVPGFFNADAMAETQREAMAQARKKLRENIEFLLRCHCDIPAPGNTVEAPRETFAQGSTVFFISLQELDLEEAELKAA